MLSNKQVNSSDHGNKTNIIHPIQNTRRSSLLQLKSILKHNPSTATLASLTNFHAYRPVSQVHYTHDTYILYTSSCVKSIYYALLRVLKAEDIERQMICNLLNISH